MTAIDLLNDQTESLEQHSSADEDNENLLSNEGSDSEGGDDENSADESDEAPNELANAGWADAISKILKTKQKGKNLVLSKAKKLTDVKKTQVKPVGFEVETTDGKFKEEVIKEVVPAEPPRKKKKESPCIRVKPNILDKDRERLLQKIATKGVVHLFNAVRSQQKDINKKLEEAGPLEVKKDKVMKNIDKRAFLDVLMGEKSQRLDETARVNVNNSEKSTGKDTTWSVLKEDFMMGAKMKDWDKELEDESEEEVEIESE